MSALLVKATEQERRRMLNAGAKYFAKEVNKQSDEGIYHEMKHLQNKPKDN